MGVFGATMLGLSGSGLALAKSSGEDLSGAFDSASKEYGVPVEVLLAVGYVGTRWSTPSASGEFEPGDLHGMGGFGLMSLSDDPKNDTLARASELTGVSKEKLKDDASANIRGAAAVLSDFEGDGRPEDLNDWYEAVSSYGSGDLYANQVYQTLKDGASGEAEDGEELGFEAQDVAETRTLYSTQAAADYGPARYYAAARGNYTVGRQGNKVRKIVIHVMQGSWSGTVNYFQDSRAGVSCHYNIRSKDGFIGQSVREKDTAYHAGHWPTNLTSIGIEHEGYVDQPNKYFTDAMYRSSAKLTAHLCKKYKIPINRNNIIGHAEVPGCSSGTGGGSSCHTDPGRYWAWGRYIQLVRSYAGGNGGDQGSTQVVDNATAGRFKASGNWDRNTYNKQRYGKNYCAAKPSRKAVDPARFKVRIPKAGRYTIFARWPANKGYNPRAAFRVKTAKGVKTVLRNQRINGGRWVTLGTHQMRKGDAWFVEVSRKSQKAGFVIADAIKIVKR